MTIQKCEICGEESKALHLHMRKHKNNNTTETKEVKVEQDVPVVTPPVETVSISKKEWEDVQNQLKMLYNVADKGRIYNYESKGAEKKPFRVKLSVYSNSIVIGWRTMKDELIKHPQTGRTVGEVQEYELLLLDNSGVESKVIINGYSAFSDARYSERVEVEVVSKKEDWQGNYTFDVILPDNRRISIDSRFVN